MDKENEVVYLKIEDIMPNKFQPREIFDETGLEELSDSIKEHGVIQPIIVRPKDGKYELIAGERRCKASSLAGLTTIPAIVREMDDRESAKVSLLENLQRKNLSAIEEARTYKRILELDNMTQDSLAKTMGKSQPAIANKLRLLGLPEEIQDALMKNQISERHARSLLNLKDKEQQLMMLERIKAERLTVRELDAEIKKLKEEPSNNINEGESDMNNNMMNNQNSNNFNTNNDMPMNNFGQFNNQMGTPNYQSNFGGMGLNDYQSSINGGMFNNIPNFNNQSNMNPTPTFESNFTTEFNNPAPMYNDNQNNNQETTNDIDYGDFKDAPSFAMPEGNTNPQMNSNNNYSSLGSMFDRAPNINNSNNNPNHNDNEGGNPFVSQIREDTIKPKENQFLPNFDTPNNFDNNQNSFEDNTMNNFEQGQDFGMNSFINQNNNNNFNSNNNFNMNSMNNMNNMNNMGNMNNFNNPIDDFSFPKQNNNMSPIDFNANQGGLFNQPLNIVNVPNNNQMNDYNMNNNTMNDNIMNNNMMNENTMNNNTMNDNIVPRNEPRFDDNYQEFNQEEKEKIDNPFDDPYEDILNAKPVAIKENQEEENQKEEPKEEPEKEEQEEPEETPNEDVEEVEVIGADPIDTQEEKEDKEEPTPDTNQEKKNDYIVLDPVKTIFDARGAVYELKKTTDTIKQNNISIDTEEIEFDDYYQITIKIKK